MSSSEEPKSEPPASKLLVPAVTGTEEKKNDITSKDEDVDVDVGVDVPAVTGTEEKKNDITSKDEDVDVDVDVEEPLPKPQPANGTTSATPSPRSRKWLYGCGCCLLVVIIIAIVLAVTLPQEETDDLYFSTCTDEAVATPQVGEAQLRLEEPVSGYEQPNLENVAVYQEIFEQPELFRHLHVHVLFMKLATGDDGNTLNSLSGLFSDDPEAVLTVTAKGDDTGSTNYFNIGSYEFPVISPKSENSINEDGVIFEWDFKGVVVFKINGTDSFEFDVKDDDTFSKDDPLMKFTLSASDLPEPGTEWVDFQQVSAISPDKYSYLEDAELFFRIKVVEGFYVDKEQIDEIFTDTDDIEYREHVLDLESGDHVVAQAWRHNSTTTTGNATGTNNSTGRKAVLWFIGRNDGFHHPHVAKELFLDQGIDLFVLNWRYNGMNPMRGFIENPYYASHNPCGDEDVYNEEVGLILELIQESGPYETLVGYAHSTGAPILLNYIIDNGDDAFDAFLFNSPFLDWANVGGDLNELVLDRIPNFYANSAFGSEPEETPEEFKDSPIMYLGKEIVISPWGVRNVYSRYYSDWTTRPKYSVPLSIGFIRSSNGAFDKINNHKGDITSKPVLVLSSVSDDVLSHTEVETLSLQIKQDREYIEYRHNFHDLFLSFDYDDTLMAIADAKAFLVEHVYDSK